ncbi:MAG TPA: hypothetical protein VGG19_14550 [Tepidisphaeraceae bacterium]|jgi:hypothetical protein
MNRYALFTLCLLSGAGLLSFSNGCSHEVSHEETDKPTLLGGHEHEEKTTVQNPDGSYSTSESKVKTND